MDLPVEGRLDKLLKWAAKHRPALYATLPRSEAELYPRPTA